MTITLDLQPDVTEALLAQAAARGLSLGDYVKEIVVRQARISPSPTERKGQEFIDSCARLRRLLTDEEIDKFFERNLGRGGEVDQN
ncbi:MAG TPA: hypothetical protein VGL53_30200 [Bryobacteraceae bacterium]|jgi:hypothetical protein